MMIAALCALTAVGCTAASAPDIQEGGELPRSIVDPYLRIQEALAADSVDGVRQNAGELATAASALGAPAMKIDTAAVQLASAGEIEDARTKFAVVSEALDAYIKGFKLRLPDGVHSAYCPMVHKPWLQEGTVVKNPYYGSSMLNCGEIR
jgi:hypothetical protein